MPPFAVFLLSLFIFLHPVATSGKEFNVTEMEKAALISFYTNVYKKPKYEGLVWDFSQPHCTWKGVYCDPSQTTIIHLRLPAFGLIGDIPGGTIGKLSNLIVLSLRFNNLTGKIPSDFYDLVLSRLRLDNNSFTGGLENINADNLKRLNVTNIEFSCSVPLTLSKFPKSAFDGNKNLCGSPLPSCNWKTYVCREPYKPRKPAKSSKSKRITIGLLAGLGLMLAILLSCLMKIYQRSKQRPKVTSEAMEGKGNNNLLILDDGNNSSLDCDELLRASAEVLGEGSVGTSYKRVLEEKNMTVVLKRLKDVAIPKTDFESHMKVLGKMKNKNLVPLKACYYSEDEKWLVYDYMDGGSLSAHLHGSIDLRQARLDWGHRMRIALSAAKGVAYLHFNNVVHDNIKSSNVLLRQETNKDATVSDYGLHTLFDKQSSPYWVTGYYAPEVIKNQIFSLESDVYSFGVLLLELLTGKAPNQASSMLQIDVFLWVQSVVHQEPKVEIFDANLRDQNVEQMFQMLRIAKDCVSIEPNKRPQMQEVVSMMEEMSRGN